MIQRSQTVYLLLAFACMVIMLFVPLYSIVATADGLTLSVEFGAYGLTGDVPQAIPFPFYVGYIALALFSAAGIFMFKNRKRQLLISRLNLLLTILVAAGLWAFYYMGTGLAADAMADVASEGAEVAVRMGLGLYLPTAAVLFILLAIRGIRNDENLVKSLDRLR